MTDQSVPPGRRERRKLQTRQRIFDVADALFAEQGYAAVTTQQIADAADVGTGTLFRYARTKAELLIMVMTERLRLGAERGLAGAGSGGDPADAVLGLIEPLVQATLTQPENTAVFQREVLFGADGPYRTEALHRIRELEEAMATVLTAHGRRRPYRPGADVRRAAAAIFSVLYVRLVRLEMGSTDPSELAGALRDDAAYLVRELLVDPRPGGPG